MLVLIRTSLYVHAFVWRARIQWMKFMCHSVNEWEFRSLMRQWLVSLNAWLWIPCFHLIVIVCINSISLLIKIKRMHKPLIFIVLAFLFLTFNYFQRYLKITLNLCFFLFSVFFYHKKKTPYPSNTHHLS